MALRMKEVEDHNMAISRVSYYDALGDEVKRLEESGNERLEEVKAERTKAAGEALKDLRGQKASFEARGDTRARMCQQEIERIEQEMGRGKVKIERAAQTMGGDAGNSRATN